MIGSIYNAVFRCSHRRTSFPHSPKAGDPNLDMYVVCLDCGKRFHYDWEQMRIGAEILPSGPSHPAEVEVNRKHSKPKVWYLVALSALPVLWIVGKTRGNKRSKE